MCARFSSSIETNDLVEACGAGWSTCDLPPRYNIAPSQPVAIIYDDEPNILGVARWGLVPAWFRGAEPDTGHVNARSETLAEKITFKGLLRRRRCLVPADGYYEWFVDTDGKKTPVRFTLEDSQAFLFAGLWDEWRNGAGQPVRTCTIITTAANELAAKVHDRMPVFFGVKDGRQWLDQGNRDGDVWRGLLRPYPAQKMRSYRVSRAINSSRAEGPDLIREDNRQEQMDLFNSL